MKVDDRIGCLWPNAIRGWSKEVGARDWPEPESIGLNHSDRLNYTRLKEFCIDGNCTSQSESANIMAIRRLPSTETTNWSDLKIQVDDFDFPSR